MALNLTPDEAAKVSVAATQDPPTYYNADQRGIVDGTEGFLAFLTLAPAATKASAVSWLQNLLVPMTEDINRQALYSSAVAGELLDTADQRLQVETFLLGYQTFRDLFPGDPRFMEVAEVVMILADTELSLLRLIQTQEDLKQRTVMGRLMEGRYGVTGAGGELTDDRKRQALSWITPLSIPRVL